MPSLTWANRILFAAVLLLQLFFLVTGASLFPSYWRAYRWDVWMPIYFTITLAALGLSLFVSGGNAYGASSPFGDPFGQFPNVEILFLGGFFVSLAVFQLPALRVPLNSPVSDATSTTLLNFAVVGFGEELMFRWFLIGLLSMALKGNWRWASIPISSAAWTGFHLAAYGETPLALVFIFIFGIPLGVAYLATQKQGGIGLPWGIHFGWNEGVQGLLNLSNLGHAIVQAAHVLLGV